MELFAGPKILKTKCQLIFAHQLKGLITERAVMEQLVPMLTVDASPKVEDLVSRAWAVLSDFMTLRPNEAAYRLN